MVEVNKTKKNAGQGRELLKKKKLSKKSRGKKIGKNRRKRQFDRHRGR